MTGATKYTVKQGFTAVNQIIDDLASNETDQGASCIGIEDAAGNFAATTVEDALAEICDDIESMQTVSDTFDEDTATTTGLTWGYKGGLLRTTSTVTAIADGTVSLTDDTTNYIEIGTDGTVYVVASAFTAGRLPIRTVVCASGVQTTSTDMRSFFSITHDAVTVSEPISVSGQALSIINDADATITEIDTGVLADSDTVVPTSKAVFAQMQLQMLKTGSNLAIGSDADGDMYYRASSALARLVKGIDAAAFWGLKNLRIIEPHASDHTKVTINPLNYTIPFMIGEHPHAILAATHVSSVTDLDTGALAAGTDYYVYACTDGTTLSFKVSANSTNPTGFDAAHSRKLGGFHTLCAAVGTISGHTLTGYATSDILPQSIWDLKHRARNLNNAGMVYDTKSQIWVDIYLASGTGASTLSANGGTISDTRNWMDFVDDGGAVGKRLLTDPEFQMIAAGSNEETNIAGSADPVTTGGHVDSASRRMISNIGCEDCVGVMFQWLADSSASYTGTTRYWGNLPGGKGSIYTVFTADPGADVVDNNDFGMDVKLIAGGNWNNEPAAGSRSRNAAYSRWFTSSQMAARFASEPL
jgi:hypothetical protein